MKIDILTLFPEVIDAVLGSSIIGRGRDAGLISFNSVHIRDFAEGRHQKTDDYIYGGGKGLLMMAEPLYRCHESVCNGEHVHTVLMSAQGTPFSQETARRLLKEEHIILVCGHYEGVDERFIEECVDEEISLGDFVLTGGEIPAMAVADAIFRLVPGVLAEEVCFTDESHWSGLLEYPQYTKPAQWHGKKVPEVLLSGHHGNIDAWRFEQSLKRTFIRRPDILENLILTDDEQKILDKIKKDLE